VSSEAEVDGAAPRLIVAYLRRGHAHDIAEALHASLGIDAFHYSHGRGAGMLATVAARDMIEVDTLSVVVTPEQAEETFAFIYEAGEMDRPGGGLIYQTVLGTTAALGLPLPAGPLSPDVDAEAGTP
jgi:nitrogen regulatory protein PII